MKRGCLIYAHNTSVDYGSQAVLAASLVKKNLKVAVSLVADCDTISDIKQKFKDLPFDSIIEVEKPVEKNFRTLAFADNNASGVVEFNNGNRLSAYDITPYDRTLVIDSDFLVFSDLLNRYWDDSHDFLISPGMLDLVENRVEPDEYPIDIYSIDMLWATTMMFSKTEETKILFDLVKFIKEEYRYFSLLYDFSPTQYRNDFAFSVACHILSGYCSTPCYGKLPTPLIVKDSDRIVDINEQRIVILSTEISNNEPWLTKCQQQDVHIMNKRDILDNLSTLLEIAK